MQHTLIPFNDRQRLHREYVMRVTAVSLFVLAASVMIGVVALFPAFVRGWFYDNAAQNDVSVAGRNKADQSLTEVRNALVLDGQLLAASAGGQNGLKYSGVIRSLLSVRGSVTISSFKVDRPDEKTVNIGIKGVAPTRGELLSFKGRLEALMPGTKVEIPIDQLAKNANAAFDLSFSRKLP